MEPQTVEFSRLIEFNNAGHAYIKMFPDERTTMTFALTKLLKHYEKPIQRLQTEWQEEVSEGQEDIRVRYCEKDKDTGTLKEKSYGEGKDLIIRKVFTPDNEKKANREIRDLNKSAEEKWLTKSVDVTKTHIIKPVPASIDILFIEAFSGFIFEPMTEDQLEAHYLAQAKKEALTPANGVH